MNNKIEHIAIKYLNKLYGDLERYVSPNNNFIIFHKNGKFYMEHDLTDGGLWICYDLIWGDLKDTFSLYDLEIASILKKWVKVNYNLNNVNPCFLD
jgi:hypothetical protein